MSPEWAVLFMSIVVLASVIFNAAIFVVGDRRTTQLNQEREPRGD